MKNETKHHEQERKRESKRRKNTIKKMRNGVTVASVSRFLFRSFRLGCCCDSNNNIIIESKLAHIVVGRLDACRLTDVS